MKIRHPVTLRHPVSRDVDAKLCIYVEMSTSCVDDTHTYMVVKCSLILILASRVVISGSTSFPTLLLYYVCKRLLDYSTMGWLRLVGSLKLSVSFAKEPYKRKCILLCQVWPA